MNNLDIFNIMSEEERIKKEIFETVYRWGQWNIVADHTAPAFESLIKDLKDYLTK